MGGMGSQTAPNAREKAIARSLLF